MREGTRVWDHWTTPQWFVDLVRKVGPIGLDPCCNVASVTNATIRAYEPSHAPDYEVVNGLAMGWVTASGLVYVNPPYSRGQIGKWVGKMVDESSAGCEIIALLPARTGAAWCQLVIHGAEAVCFMNKRIRFDNPPPGEKNTSPRFDSMVAYWGPRREKFAAIFAAHGVITGWSAVIPCCGGKVIQSAHASHACLPTAPSG